MNEIDQGKLDKMWKQILEYEQGRGMSDSSGDAVKRIMEIIDEVYKECY